MPRDENEIWSAYAKTVNRLKPARADKNSVIPAKAGIQYARDSAKESSARGRSPLDSRWSLPRAPTRGGNDENIQNRLDRSIERRLKQGEIVPEARLDLHGMRQDEAHEALEKFLAAAVRADKRLLLIITGKGRAGDGVLRANLKNWLEASPAAPRILALRPAAVRHGGSGAFYVLLRKRKEQA